MTNIVKYGKVISFKQSNYAIRDPGCHRRVKYSITAASQEDWFMAVCRKIGSAIDAALQLVQADDPMMARQN